MLKDTSILLNYNAYFQAYTVKTKILCPKYCNSKPTCRAFRYYNVLGKNNCFLYDDAIFSGTLQAPLADNVFYYKQCELLKRF